ncbi:hypothetical protein PLEI_1450 [Photobacterium leiognathi lrivu.4.1]|uniref:Uncharacterized protein n=1 Tax=Photobacterium leiognathi lrivu.4.1 TaxID=1248232 RepID=A0A0U1P561_PHOLE|nr:hypothetical protein [Photobacterium leiognathi]GAD29797.1 hypothetical protein PLEI_1450 [Photobacterium leiognathi lrivu.4.1]
MKQDHITDEKLDKLKFPNGKPNVSAQKPKAEVKATPNFKDDKPKPQKSPNGKGKKPNVNTEKEDDVVFGIHASVKSVDPLKSGHISDSQLQKMKCGVINK